MRAWVWLLLGTWSVPAMAAGLAPWQVFLQQVRPALLRQQLIDPARALVHLSHSCDLRAVNGALFHVLEVRELVRGGLSPRGVNQLVVLDVKLRVTAHLELMTARPLYCEGMNVVLYGDVEALEQEGNRLTLNRRGELVGIGAMEAKDMQGLKP